MTLKVIWENEVIFSADDGENVMIPLDDDERAEVFHALTSALATLAGVTPRYSHAAKEALTDGHEQETEQCLSARNNGVVVHLRARSEDQNNS